MGMRWIGLFGLAAMLSGCATVRPGESGIKFMPFRSEQPTTVLGPGTYGKAPWNKIVRYDLRWRTDDEKAEVQTSDKLHMTVNVSITYRPIGARLYEIHTSLGQGFYDTTVKPAMVTAVRNEIAEHTHDEVVPKAAQLQDEILTDMRTAMAAYGIEVARINFDDIDYPPAIAGAITDQLATVQKIKNQELALTLAQKEADVASQVAKGASQARLAGKESEVASATKDAEIAIIRARAEAEVAKLRAVQLTPAYLRLRTIEAMEKVGASPNSKVYMMPVGKDGIPWTVHEENEAR